MPATDKLFKQPAALKPNQKSVIKKPPGVEGKPTPARRPPRGSLQTISEEPVIEEIVGPDPFVKSNLVFGLNNITFKEFTFSKDVAFVLFYDPTDASSHWCKPRLAKAAEITKRDNHAYAAVNCIENPFLCYRQSAINLPAYVLYSRGRKVKKIRETADVTSENIKTFVEKAPVSKAVARRPGFFTR